MKLKHLAAPAAIVGLAFALAACGGTTDAGPSVAPAAASDRQANAESPAAEATTEADPTTEAVGRSLGTHVCVENKLDAPITVAFTTFDSTDGNTTIGPYKRTCAEGTFAMAPDVAGRITLPTGRRVAFSGFNPAIGYPHFDVTEADNFTVGRCRTYAVGHHDRYNNGLNDFRVTRHDDAGWKMFTIQVDDRGYGLSSGGC